MELPLMVASMWFGRALAGEVAPQFRQRGADAAKRYRGEVDFVLFTDIPRVLFDAVRDGVPDHDSRPVLMYVPESELTRIKQMLDWARGDGSYRVHLVNLFEVFNSETLMPWGSARWYRAI